MEINRSQVSGRGCRYVSQIPNFKNGLPFGILNKVITDSGGTFAAMNYPFNYIVVVPGLPLLDSILKDKNNKYPVFGLCCGVSYNSFKEYVHGNKIHKIAVTYDSLPKLKKWLDKNNFESSKYKVLVDEFHLLLSEIQYRADAILNLMAEITYFEHYTFMSATPIEDDLLPEVMMRLPHTKIVWDHTTAIHPIRKKAHHPLQYTTRLIKEFQAGMLVNVNGTQVRVEQLFIFLNSVKAVKQIISTAKLTDDDVKVVCADTIRNREVLGNIEIGTVTEPNAPINFFTKNCFEGVNIFSNNGLVVVVSDARKSHTLIDIATTMHQIAGRLRVNAEYNNILKGVIVHVYSNTKLFVSEEEFCKMLDEIKIKTKQNMSIYNSLKPEDREFHRLRTYTEDLFCHYNQNTNQYEYAELLENRMKQNHKLINKVYADGVSVRNAYTNAGFEDSEEDYICKDSTVLDKISTVGDKELLKMYVALRKSNDSPHLIERYELEHPWFREAYEGLGEAGLETCKWQKKLIMEKTLATSDSTTRMVLNKFYNKVGEGVFISNADAKNLLQSIFKENGFYNIKVVLSLLDKARWFTITDCRRRIDRKEVYGVVLNKVDAPANNSLLQYTYTLKPGITLGN